MGLKAQVVDFNTLTEVGKDISAILFQYPDTNGSIQDFQTLIDKTHAAGVGLNLALRVKERIFILHNHHLKGSGLLCY